MKTAHSDSVTIQKCVRQMDVCVDGLIDRITFGVVSHSSKVSRGKNKPLSGISVLAVPPDLFRCTCYSVVFLRQ